MLYLLTLYFFIYNLIYSQSCSNVLWGISWWVRRISVFPFLSVLTNTVNLKMKHIFLHCINFYVHPWSWCKYHILCLNKFLYLVFISFQRVRMYICLGFEHPSINYIRKYLIIFLSTLFTNKLGMCTHDHEKPY